MNDYDDMKQVRDTGLFRWEECGRSFVARFGKLRAVINRRGSQARGDVRFRVADVFGQQHFSDAVGDWVSNLDDAIKIAEAVILHEAKVLWPNVQRANQRRRRRR